MYFHDKKSDITKVPNSEEKSKRKVPNQTADLKKKTLTHQTNGSQLSYSRHGTINFFI